MDNFAVIGLQSSSAPSALCWNAIHEGKVLKQPKLEGTVYERSMLIFYWDQIVQVEFALYDNQIHCRTYEN